MKIQLSEVDKHIIERVCKITKGTTGIDDDDYIEVDTLLAILDEFEDSYKDLETEFEEYKANVEENYKPIGEGDDYRFYSHTINKLNEECDRQWQFIKERGLEEEYGEYTGKRN